MENMFVFDIAENARTFAMGSSNSSALTSAFPNGYIDDRGIETTKNAQATLKPCQPQGGHNIYRRCDSPFTCEDDKRSYKRCKERSAAAELS